MSSLLAKSCLLNAAVPYQISPLDSTSPNLHSGLSSQVRRVALCTGLGYWLVPRIPLSCSHGGSSLIYVCRSYLWGWLKNSACLCCNWS